MKYWHCLQAQLEIPCIVQDLVVQLQKCNSDGWMSFFKDRCLFWAMEGKTALEQIHKLKWHEPAETECKSSVPLSYCQPLRYPTVSVFKMWRSELCRLWVLSTKAILFSLKHCHWFPFGICCFPSAVNFFWIQSCGDRAQAMMLLRAYCSVLRWRILTTIILLIWLAFLLLFLHLVWVGLVVWIFFIKNENWSNLVLFLLHVTCFYFAKYQWPEGMFQKKCVMCLLPV